MLAWNVQRPAASTRGSGSRDANRLSGHKDASIGCKTSSWEDNYRSMGRKTNFTRRSAPPTRRKAPFTGRETPAIGRRAGSTGCDGTALGHKHQPLWRRDWTRRPCFGTQRHGHETLRARYGMRISRHGPQPAPVLASADRALRLVACTLRLVAWQRSSRSRRLCPLGRFCVQNPRRRIPSILRLLY